MSESVSIPLPFVGLAGAVFGTALSLSLGWRAAIGRQARLLSAFLLCYAAVAGFISARHGRFVPAGVWGDHLVNITGLCLYPLFIWYAAKTARRPAWTWWMPAFAYATWLTAALLGGWDSRVPFRVLLPIVFGYTLLATLERMRARAAWREAEAAAPSLIPIDALLLFSFAVNVAQAVRTFWNTVPLIRDIVPTVVTCGFACLGLLAAARATRRLTNAARPSAGSPKYERSALDDRDAEALLHRLDALLDRERPHLDPTLTLASLATRAGVGPHALSQALNQRRGTTFYAHMNRLRVAEARALLRDPSRAHHTIEAIARDAGFPSRSTFYKAFRDSQGISPVEFRKRASSPAPR